MNTIPLVEGASAHIQITRNCASPILIESLPRKAFLPPLVLTGVGKSWRVRAHLTIRSLIEEACYPESASGPPKAERV